MKVICYFVKQSVVSSLHCQKIFFTIYGSESNRKDGYERKK